MTVTPTADAESQEPTAEVGRKQGLLALGLVLLLICAAYAPSLGGGFVYDDSYQITGNPAIATDDALRTAFTTSIWKHVFESNNYRPVFYLWLIGQYRCFGLDVPAVGYRLTLLALHLIVTALVYALGRKLGLRPLVAAGGALLFGLHPQRVSSVAWISGANDPLLAAFGVGALLALLAAHRETTPRRAFAWRGASILLFALALFSKEPGITLVGVLAAVECAGPGIAPTLGLRRRAWLGLRGIAPALLVVGLYLAMRFGALGYLTKPAASPIGAWQAVLTAPVLLASYVGRFLWPHELLLGPGLLPVERVLDPRFAVGLLVGGALLTATFVLARGEGAGRRRVLLALSWFPIVLQLDARNLPDDLLVQDRYLYVSSIGVALLLADGVARLCNRKRVAPRARLLAAALLALVLAGLSAHEGLAWRSNETLYARAALAAPTSRGVIYGYGVERLNAKDPATAAAAFERAVTLEPRFARAWEGLGRSRLAQGDAAGAAEAFAKQLEIEPDHLNGLLYLARARLRANDARGALEPAQRLKRLRPEDARASQLMAEVEAALGR